MKTRLFLLFALLLFQGSFAKTKLTEFLEKNEKIVVTDPIAVTLPNLSVCDNNNDGLSVFDLTVQTPIILGAQTGNSSDYVVTYHETLSEANFSNNPLTSPYFNITPFSQMMYYKITNINTNAYAVGDFQLIVNAPLALTAPTPLKVCDSDGSPNDAYTSFDLTVKDAQITQGSVGYTVTYYPTLPITPSSVAIVDPTAYVNIVPAIQTLGVKVTSPEGCVSYTTLDIKVLPIPTPNINPPILVACDGNGDGLEVFDLTVNAAYIINSDPSVVFHYYATFSDALNSSNEILAPTSALVGFSVWIKVANSQIDFQGNSCYTLVEQPIQVTNSLSPYIFSQGNGNSICVDYNTNAVLSALTLQTNYGNSAAYTFQWYENGVLIAGASNPTYTINTSFPDGATNQYNVVVTSASYPGCNGFSNAYTVFQSGPATVPINSTGYTIVNLSGVQSIIVEINGYGTYEYSLDNGAHQESNVFENVSLGDHTITIWDTEGGTNYSCEPLIINNVEIVASQVAAPTGSNSQSFVTGATLANIVVGGTNVQWFSSASSSSPLPLNTVLVNGTTYYATQTVSGIQSSARLAVTVNLPLSTPNNELLPIYYSPNPVKNILKLQSNTVLKSVKVYTMLGQQVFEQSYNDMTLSIDLSNLNTGNYIVKVESVTGQKILRIIKE